MKSGDLLVLDSNILLVIVSRKSRYNPIFRALLNGTFQLAVTTEILHEYAEILERYVSKSFADATLELILGLPGTKLITRYYAWNLITVDPDDNKFVDCAIAANARFIVSDDKHFRVLEAIEFPKVEVMGLETFFSELEDG